MLADGEFAAPAPSHRFPSVTVASGSLPACARWDHPPANGDATVGVFVPSTPSSACKAASFGSCTPTTRSSAAVLNKPFSNPRSRYRSADHLLLGLISIM